MLVENIKGQFSGMLKVKIAPSPKNELDGLMLDGLKTAPSKDKVAVSLIL